MSSSVHRSVLAAVPVFSGMSDAERDDILALASSRHFLPGKAIFEQGAPAENFFVLLSGRLRVTQTTSEGQQTVVRMVNPGDLFGIARALRRPDYPGTATTVVDSVVLQWPMVMWDSLIERHPKFLAGAMLTVGQRLQEAHSRLQEFATEEVERRVAHAVLRLANQGGRKEAEGIRIDFPLSKQDIAEMTGTTLHTVSRILTAWEKASLIEGGRQKLLVREPHRLFLIAEGGQPGLL